MIYIWGQVVAMVMELKVDCVHSRLQLKLCAKKKSLGRLPIADSTPVTSSPFQGFPQLPTLVHSPASLYLHIHYLNENCMVGSNCFRILVCWWKTNNFGLFAGVFLSCCCSLTRRTYIRSH